MSKEKLFDYGDSKFKVIISDELIMDPNTNHSVQVRVNPAECENLIQRVYINTHELSRLVLVQGLAYAVRVQYDNFAVSVKPKDSCVSSRDYFWALDSLLQVSMVFCTDVFSYLTELGYKIKK